MSTKIPESIRNRVRRLRATGLTYREIAVRTRVKAATARKLVAGRQQQARVKSPRSAITSWCEVCRHAVTMPCIACATRAAMASGELRRMSLRDGDPLEFNLAEAEQEGLREVREAAVGHLARGRDVEGE